MSYSNRIFFYGPVGLLLLIVAAVSAFWWVQADRLGARLDRANGHEIAPGIVFAFAEKSVGGFPFRLDAVLSGVTFAHRGPDGETAWRSEKLALHMQTYDSSHYIFEAAGLQSIAFPGIAGGPPRVTYLTASVAHASAILRNGKPERFDLDLWAPQAKDASLGADPKRTLAAARAQFHVLQRPNNTIDIAMKIDDAHIGDAYKPLLGSGLPLVDLRGTLGQTEPLDALASGAQSAFDAIEQWRAKGGNLSIEKADLNWSGFKTALSGVLTLDAAHHLTGTLTGPFDAGALMAALTHGALNLSGSGTATLSLLFEDGDILVGANSPAAGLPR